MRGRFSSFNSYFLLLVVSCAPIQGYHPASHNLVRPGAGSARVEYQSVAGFVNGSTTTPEQAIGAISRANMSDSQAWVLRECYSRYGWRCNMWGYGYGGRYSRPGYTLGGINAVESFKNGEPAGRLAREVLRGAKLAADLTLQQSAVVERAFGASSAHRADRASRINGTDRGDRPNKVDRTGPVPPQCQGDCEKCGTCMSFWR